MSKILSGFTPNTSKNLQLDAGILIKNLTDPASFDGTIPSDAVKIGATSGGGQFDAIAEFRNLYEDLDGARGNYMDGNAIDNWDIKLTATVKEMTIENLMLALGVGDADTTTDNNYNIVTARLNVKSSDYLKNVCWLGTMNGSDKPLIIELRNVLNTAGLSLKYSDKATGSIDLELKAHFSLDNPSEVPFTIYSPKQTA